MYDLHRQQRACREDYRAIKDADIVAASVLSGNRNFEGRINPFTRANFLASPPLVAAYALAGTVTTDLVIEQIGDRKDRRGGLSEGHLADAKEINAIIKNRNSGNLS